MQAMNPQASDWPQDGSGIEVVPAYEIVSQRLRRAIHLGELPPGSKLPPERTLASRLEVSRITLREAIRKLEGEGYVRVERGSRGGTFVHSGAMSRAEVRSWMRKRWDELEALIDFRLANERCAAERAAERIEPAELAELREIIEEGRGSDDISSLRTSDVRFHNRIAEIAASERLRQAIEEARAELYVPFRALPLEDMRKHTIPQHARIVDALESGDPRRAADAVEAHLHSSAKQFRLLAGKD